MFAAPARAQYAIRAMTNLALRPDRTATSADIAQAESIPAKYLEGIMSRLKAAGLVESARGKNGGYTMALDPFRITMLQVVEAVEGRVRPVSCVDGTEVCGLFPGCHPRSFWLGLKNTIDAYLQSCTLGDIVGNPAGHTDLPAHS